MLFASLTGTNSGKELLFRLYRVYRVPEGAPMNFTLESPARWWSGSEVSSFAIENVLPGCLRFAAKTATVDGWNSSLVPSRNLGR